MTPEEQAQADREMAARPDYWLGQFASLCAFCLDPNMTSGQARKAMRSTLAAFLVSPALVDEGLREIIRRHL